MDSLIKPGMELLARTLKGSCSTMPKLEAKQIQSTQLIIKFKERLLYRHTARRSHNAVLEAGKAVSREEVAQLRRQLDSHPEMLNVKTDMSLRDMLQKHEKHQTSLEEREEQKDKVYSYSTSEKLLELGRRAKQHHGPKLAALPQRAVFWTPRRSISQRLRASKISCKCRPSNNTRCRQTFLVRDGLSAPEGHQLTAGRVQKTVWQPKDHQSGRSEQTAMSRAWARIATWDQSFE
jgi:hypothetical protein